MSIDRRPWDYDDDLERIAASRQNPPPHYELHDGTCVTCGEPWMCTTAETTA